MGRREKEGRLEEGEESRMEEEGGARRGRPARPLEGGRRRKAERGGAGRRGQLREDGGGRRSEEGPASGEWRGRTEEEADTESSKEEEVTARAQTEEGRRGHAAQMDQRGLSGCVCEWIRMEEMGEMNGLAVALFRKRRYC